MKKISQREARRLRKRVAELEGVASRNAQSWAREWVGGIQVAKSMPSSEALAAIRTARKLKHAVVSLPMDDGSLIYYAVKA